VVETTRGRKPVKTEVYLTDTVRATLPGIKKVPVTQETFCAELDPYSHDVLFDDNVPAITVKTQKGGYMELKQYRVAIPFQKIICNKQVRHLCTNHMQHTLLNTDPTEKQSKDFIRIKQGWEQKNMEALKTTFVRQQKSYGDAALLFFMENGRVGARNICFDDGYTIITHKNQNGKHVLECLYYEVDEIEYIDCYDDEKMTRFTNDVVVGADGKVTANWNRHEAVYHGFSENPLITKRGDVAWNEGQTFITSFEAMWNTFIVIQKRHGWGIIYIKGQIQDNAKKIAGNVVLVDNSGSPESDAKILDSPDPQHSIDTLKAMKQQIEIATGTTFILPEDINISSDISGLAVELTQELDMNTAMSGVGEWQNVASKMMRLFVEGFAKELVNTGEEGYEAAITDFSSLRIQSQLQVWKPRSEEAHNIMVEAAKGAGIISLQTAVEKNTLSSPDEMMRLKREEEEAARKAAEQATVEAAAASSSTDNGGGGSQGTQNAAS
jgi:hypothetical protein